jgi:hypothetical protein
VLELGSIKLDGFQQPRVKHPKSYLVLIELIFLHWESFSKFFQYNSLIKKVETTLKPFLLGDHIDGFLI